MAEHTPGPWSGQCGNDGTFGLFAHPEKLGAQLIGEFFDEDMGDALPASANLYLAAASPTMLAALQYARNLIGPDEIIDAAIAKVTQP